MIVNFSGGETEIVQCSALALSMFESEGSALNRFAQPTSTLNKNRVNTRCKIS